jgi:hypothetical protein
VFDYWRSDPDNHRRCLTCSGTGKKICRSCGGNGGRCKPRYDSEYEDRSIVRESWEPCVTCAGSGRSSCSTCLGIGRIRASEPDVGRLETKPATTKASTPEDLKIEFNRAKEKTLARILNFRTSPNNVTWELRDQLRAIKIESRSASVELRILSSKLIRTTFGTPDHTARILTTMIDTLELIASRYSKRVAETA